MRSGLDNSTPPKFRVGARKEPQWLKPLILTRLMSRLMVRSRSPQEPRPTRHQETIRQDREHLHCRGTRTRSLGAKKMAGGLPMPANQTFLSFRDEAPAMSPEKEPGVT